MWWLSDSALWYVSLPCHFSPVVLDPPAAWLQDSALSIPSLWLCFFSGAGSDLSTLRQKKQGTEQASDRRSIISTGRVQLTVFGGERLGTGNAFEKYHLFLKTFFLERKGYCWKYEWVLFDTVCKVFVRQWQFLFKLWTHATDASGCTVQWQVGKKLPHNTFPLCYIYSPPHWWKSTGDFRECVSEAYERKGIPCAVFVKICRLLQ